MLDEKEKETEEEDTDDFDFSKPIDNRTVYLMLKQQAKRMTTLETKFDDLLEKIDGRMGQLIDVLVDRSKGTIPVSTFTQMLFIVTLAIFVAMFGASTVISVIHEIKEYFTK